jgi:signal transduction histidine kinase
MSQETATEQHITEQLREFQALFQISQMLARSMDLPNILRQIVDAAVSLIPHAEQAVIHLIDETHSLLKPLAVARPDQSSATSPIFFRSGEGIAGLVIKNGKTINVIDTQSDHRFLSHDESPVFYRSLLVAPIKLNDNTIGTLSVESLKAGAFSDYFERLLTNLGEQAALAIERAQILQDEQEQRQLAEALREASNIQSSESNLQTILNQILGLLKKVLKYDTAIVMLIENGKVEIVQENGFDHKYHKKNKQFFLKVNQVDDIPQLHRVVLTGQAFSIHDTQKESGWICELEDTRAWIGAPIHALGKTIGIISLCKLDVGFYNQKHADRLAAFASQTSLTIQNAQLFETTQKRLREVNLLYRISQRLAESLDADVILQQVSNWLKEQFGFYYVQVLLLDKSGEQLVFRQGSDPAGLLEINDTHSLFESGIPGHVALTNHSFVSNNVNEVPFYVAHHNLPDTLAELAVPLRIGDKLLGVLDIHHKAPNEFKDQDLQLIFAIAEQITLAIEKAMIYDDLEKTLTKEQAARTQLVQSEKLAALGRIVASVAHELNNPLQAIQNALYLINLEENLNNQVREDLQVALNEANRMAGLISRLRETYRPITGEEFQLCSINSLVTEVEKLIGTHLRQNDIKFQFVPDDTLPECFLIQDQIKQVILNISLNAVESMPNGGTLKIATHHPREQKSVYIDISDTGSGIPPDVLPYIFDPFVTTKDRGTGLGLAITYDIVRRHGGQITPESQMGRGTIFHIWLPIERPI